MTILLIFKIRASAGSTVKTVELAEEKVADNTGKLAGEKEGKWPD